MNKLKIFLLAILIIISIIIINRAMYYQHIEATYTIEPEKLQFENAIVKWINRPTPVTDKIEIKQELNLDNKKYFIITFGKWEGYAELTKGPNNKYKMGESGYGDGSIYDCEIWDTNKGKYIILFCKNKVGVQYAKVELEGKEYKINIPKKDYIITFCEVPDSTKVRFIDVNHIKFYNINNTEVRLEAILN
ncbi:MAG: hypothetical protein K0S47_2498 [Herbinix sp.]|jgi:hypothetical protein|nr:hypothetical protein [Herbinix sp.]